MNPRTLALVAALLAAPLGAQQQFDPASTNAIIDQLTADLARLKAEVNKTAPGPVVIRVPDGGDVQAALDMAQPGQTILLAPATFIGNYTLRKKASAGVITIRTDGLTDAMIPPTLRVPGPLTSPLMAKLGPKDPSLQTLTAEFGADGYTLIGIEFLGNAVLPDRSLVLFGHNAKTLAELPRHITFDRVYAHGDPVKGGRTGCNCHGIDVTIINGWWSGFWYLGQDSQAIGVYNGAGPYLIENNYLEAAGENVMFGGADPAIPGLISSDIVVRRNYVSKPLAWKTRPSTVKNLFELKNAQRVLIEYNVFENVWADSQSGNAIVFTPRNQDGGCPWCVVQDVVFQYNVVKHVQTYAFNLIGKDNNQLTNTLSGRVTIRHNVIEASRGLLAQDGVDGLAFDHNLLVGVTGQMFALGKPLTHVSITNNIMRSGLYAITGDATTIGKPSIDACCTPYVFTNNVIELPAAGFIAYPAGNFLLAAGTLVGRLDAMFHFRADASHVTTDGTPIGPDLARLLQGLQGVAATPLADIVP